MNLFAIEHFIKSPMAWPMATMSIGGHSIVSIVSNAETTLTWIELIQGVLGIVATLIGIVASLLVAYKTYRGLKKQSNQPNKSKTHIKIEKELLHLLKFFHIRKGSETKSSN